jgi:hypothetical protein
MLTDLLNTQFHSSNPAIGIKYFVLRTPLYPPWWLCPYLGYKKHYCRLFKETLKLFPRLFKHFGCHGDAPHTTRRRGCDRVGTCIPTPCICVLATGAFSRSHVALKPSVIDAEAWVGLLQYTWGSTGVDRAMALHRWKHCLDWVIALHRGKQWRRMGYCTT